MITRLKTIVPYIPSTQAMDGFYGTFYKIIIVGCH